jgi:phosphoserine phosphatase
LATGDGSNDLAMLKIAGMGVAFRAKPAVAEAAQYTIQHGDLTGLLYLQGYSESQFKTA